MDKEIHSSFQVNGQTGSGKTYTMYGSQEDPGILPLTLQEIYARVEATNAAAGIVDGEGGEVGEAEKKGSGAGGDVGGGGGTAASALNHHEGVRFQRDCLGLVAASHHGMLHTWLRVIQ